MRLGLAGSGVALIALGLAPRPAVGQGIADATAAAVAGYQLRSSGDGGAGMVGGFLVRFGFHRGALGVGPEFLLQNGADLRIRALSGVLQVRQRTGRFRPFLAAGLGAYTWQNRVEFSSPDVVVPGGTELWKEVNYFSGSLGGGVALGIGAGELVMEARWHRNLAETTARGARSLIAVSAGVKVSW